MSGTIPSMEIDTDELKDNTVIVGVSHNVAQSATANALS